jgi:hypothetical protein
LRPPKLIRYKQQLHTIACKQMTAPACHGGRRACDPLARPSEAGAGGRQAAGHGDAAPITLICVHRLTLL